jgi:hypothetical protein
MSLCALLVIGMLRLSPVSGRIGLSARSAFWRQFPAHECPRANQKGGADNRRRGERGEILEHERYLDPSVQSRSAGCCARNRHSTRAGTCPPPGGRWHETALTIADGLDTP